MLTLSRFVLILLLCGAAWAHAQEQAVPTLKSPVTDLAGALSTEQRTALERQLLEFERSKDILSRVLPRPPVRVIDVGGAAGAYSAWLADQGYEVHLVDASSRLVACTTARSALSAKNSMNRKMIAALSSSTIVSGTGITPSAP